MANGWLMDFILKIKMKKFNKFIEWYKVDNIGFPNWFIFWIISGTIIILTIKIITMVMGY